ncbi:hypothetical protein ACHAXA_006842, partial [Cyclostephanos tholiformis]
MSNKILELTTTTPHHNDVLCGRGGTVNAHPGNEQYRKFVDQKKRLYLTARFKREKRLISSKIVDEIRNLDPPGRFLLKDANSDVWRDIGDEKARDKTSQSLRENALAVRRQLEDDFEKAQMKQAQVANDAAGRHPVPGLAAGVAAKVLPPPGGKSGWPPPPQAPWGFPSFSQHRQNAPPPHNPKFPQPRSQHATPPHDPMFSQPQHCTPSHLPLQHDKATTPSNYPYFPPQSLHSGELKQPPEMQQQQHAAQYYGGMPPPSVQPPHFQHQQNSNWQLNLHQQQQNPTSLQSSILRHNLVVADAVQAKVQTQPDFMSACGSSDAANAGPPNALDQLTKTTQPLGTASAASEDVCLRTSLLSADESLLQDRRVQFHTAQQRGIGDIPLVITPMKRFHPRKPPPTLGTSPGSSILLPGETPSDAASMSHLSQHQNMPSSQDDMSLGCSQATQATPLTFFSADLSFKSHDTQDVELTQYLQGLEDEISGDVGQEVELVAHAPMFDDERQRRHSQQNRQRQHHGGIPAYSRSTPPRHCISGGSRIGGSISGSTGFSDSDRRRKRRSGSHIPSNSGQVQLDLSTLGRGEAASASSGGGDAQVFVNHPQATPTYSSTPTKGSPGLACGDKLTSSLQNSNHCQNFTLSPMSPVYSLDLDKMSLCGTENISQAGGSIGGASLCNVFDDPSDGPVGTSNLMDMTMSVGSHPSSGGTYGSGVTNYAPIGLGLHQTLPLDVSAQTEFDENNGVMNRMDMSVGSGRGTKSSSSGGSSSRSRRSGSPASIDKASAD